MSLALGIQLLQRWRIKCLMPELWVTPPSKYVSPLVPLQYSSPAEASINLSSHTLDGWTSTVQRGSGGISTLSDRI